MDGGFRALFVDGLSTWNPVGLGNDLSAPAINAATLLWWLLAATGLSPQAVLFVYLAGLFVAGQLGFVFALRAFKVELPRLDGVILGLVYAFGPVCFQKFAAGHLYVVQAYELLPAFCAMVWRGADRCRSWWRFALGAGLLLSLMETQIQYLLFGLIVAALLCAASVWPRRAAATFAIVTSIGLVHVLPLIFNVDHGESQTLIAQHANAVWQQDLSGDFLALLTLGGYVGYDRAALPAPLLPWYEFGGMLFALLAIAGALLSRSLAPQRRPAAAWLSIAAFALCWAGGSNSLFAVPFSIMLRKVIFFTIVREYYHIMPLYALAGLMLTSIALSQLPRWAARTIAVLLLLLALPFASMGAQRLVPAVLATDFGADACSKTANLCLLLPARQPIGIRGTNAAGIDPARLERPALDVNAMPFASFAVARLSAGDARFISALGVDAVQWRPSLYSALPSGFEPHVGADFRAFRQREKQLRREFLRPRVLAGRPALALENADTGSILDTVPGASAPPGSPLSFTSSFENNDIDTSWVLGSLWAWQVPRLDEVTSANFVVTRSDAPLVLHASSDHAAFLYVLAAAKRPRLDGRAPDLTIRLKSTPYAWYGWHVATNATRFVFRAKAGLSAVSMAVASSASRWTPALRARGTALAALSARWDSPWRITGTLPFARTGDRLVLARSFSKGWDLFVDGADLGAPVRVHGFFNGWTIPTSIRGGTFTIVRSRQRGANAINALVAIANAAVLVALCSSLRFLRRGTFGERSAEP